MTASLENAQEISVEQWGTLNTAASPHKLPAGHSPNNNNIWTDEKPGSVITANGYRYLGVTPSGNPATFQINFFKTSDGSSMLVLSDGVTVWKTTDYVNFTQIVTGLSEFFQLRGMVIRDKLWLTNGSDAVMTYDGTTLSTLDGTSSTPNVPRGKYIAYHDERVWMYGISGDPSAARFTALTNTSGTEIAPDNASAWPTDNELQVSEGDADVGTALFILRGYLYASKQYSIWRITGYDEYSYTRVKTRSSTGTRFNESVQIHDNLAKFIGVDGLYVFDGEESKRISDILDPSSADEGVFAFRNLQQPLLNNNFWNTSETADFNSGTVPNVLSTANDQLALVPADDSDADFNSGTHDDTVASSGNLQLDLVSSGGTTENVALGGTPSLGGSGFSLIGSASSINDGSFASSCGSLSYASGLLARTWQVIFPSQRPVGSVTIKSFYFEREGSVLSVTDSKLQYYDGSSWADVPGGSVALPSAVNMPSQPRIYLTSPSAGSNPSASGIFVNETDITINFSTIVVSGLRWYLVGDGGAYTIRELQVFRAGYEPDGEFISASIDYGSAPPSFGNLAATITANGETYQFSTQSSDDGSTWDSAVNVSNGAAIGSTLRRYLRWRVTLASSTGISTPVIDKVYVGGTFLSTIFNTGGNINQWSALQAELSKSGQTITLYYRAAATAGAVSGESWTEIVPGAVPAADVTDVYVQFRAFLNTTDATQAPIIQSVRFNWIVGTGSGINTLQNVASSVWLNRYWLSAATLGATENDIVLVLGKSTFGSPWHKKDFKILSFCRYNGILIGAASDSGNLYQLESGYSKNGSAIDSYYETQEFSKAGVEMQILEMLVDLERSGPYTVSIGISTDNGLTYTEKTIDLTRASGVSLNFTKKLNWNIKADHFRVRVRNNAADQPFAVHGIRVFYRLMPNRGSIN